jgi:hypothetical protein
VVAAGNRRRYPEVRGRGNPWIEKRSEMSTKLFIGGLPWAMDNERLKQVFAEFGDVADARVILDRDTGRSRGFGFVTYANEAGAENALALDGTEIDGRRIRVDRATEKERPARPAGPPSGRGRPEGGPGGGRPAGGRDFGGGGGGGGDSRPPAGAPPPAREGDRPGGRPRGAGPDRDAGPGAAPRRDFAGDDWGSGERGERGRRGAAKGKGRGRRRGGRGGRGGGEDHDEVPPTSGVVEDFDDWD